MMLFGPRRSAASLVAGGGPAAGLTFLSSSNLAPLQRRGRSTTLPADAPAGPTRAEHLVAGVVSVVVAVGLAVGAPALWHWALVPILACGTLMGADAIGWLRARVDLFDPVGLVGLLGYHFFFLAPLLHVAWDFWITFPDPPGDWRPWLGAMACVNVAGIIAYRFGRRAGLAQGRRALLKGVPATARRPRRFEMVAVLAIVVTAVMQGFVFARFGGPVGYIAAQTSGDTQTALAGMGWILVCSESFPILLAMTVAFAASRRGWRPSWPTIALAFLGFVVLQFLVAGLRGSRSNTLWAVLWGAGLVHLWTRRIPRTLVVCSLPLLFLFLYGYGFYKTYGADAFYLATDSVARARAAEKSGRTTEFALLTDLGRSDAQAALLRWSVGDPRMEHHAWGRTYLATFAVAIPKSVWPDRPATKAREGTDALYGAGAFDGGQVSTRVYGLAGEALLNWGVAGVPVVFWIWGWVLGRVRALLGIRGPDTRLLILPCLVSVCIVLLLADFDNDLFFLVKNAMVPVLVVALGSGSGSWVRSAAPRLAPQWAQRGVAR